MAHATASAPAQKKEASTPTVRVSWDSDSKVKVTGAIDQIALKKRAVLEIEGSVIGFSMGEYGCSIEVKASRVSVERVSAGTDEDAAEDATPMADMVKKLRGGQPAPKPLKKAR